MQLLKINEINSLNIFPLNNLTKSQKFYFFDSTAQALKFYAEETNSLSKACQKLKICHKSQLIQAYPQITFVRNPGRCDR